MVLGAIFWGGATAVGLLLASLVLVGGRAARRVRAGSAADLSVAGRALPVWLAALTMTATWVDGGYLLGTVEGVFYDSLPAAMQPGLCYGLGLVVGGLVFAGPMRRRGFTTLVDLFDARFGPGWAAALLLPALLGELACGAVLLTALGSVCRVMLGLDASIAILAGAAVVVLYTARGGLWALAWTDAYLLTLIPLGLLGALAVALSEAGNPLGFVADYLAGRPRGFALFPPAAPDARWSSAMIVAWWDRAPLLLLGGIPWNLYFQCVLACRSPREACRHSYVAGALTMALTIPPVLLGLAAYTRGWEAAERAQLRLQPELTLPLLLRDLTPAWVGLLGLAAVVGAITTSLGASLLSGGSLLTWNVYRRLLAPAADAGALGPVLRGAVVLQGVLAALLALRLPNVDAQPLWLLCIDLIYVLLFPQLVTALFDSRANRVGSAAAVAGALALRLTLPLLPGAEALPYRTLAMLAGLALAPAVSRLTAGWDPPRPLPQA